MREALKKSANFLRSVGRYLDVKVDHWWKEKGYLFEDKYVVRRLSAGEQPSNPELLIVEIPLSRSPTMLIKDVKALIQEAFASQDKSIQKE